MSKWIGYAVSVNCGEPLGCYQGTILEADGSTITLTKAFRNGFPYPKSQVTLKAADIKQLKIIESKGEDGKVWHSTVPVSKHKKGPLTADVQPPPAGTDSWHASVPVSKNKKGPPAIDVLQPPPGASPGGRGRGGAAERARRRDEACFGAAAEPALRDDFDFEGNLALFDRAALRRELRAARPDLLRHADDKLRPDEPALPVPPAPAPRPSALPDELRAAADCVTDDGARVPCAAAPLRRRLWADLRRLGVAAVADALLARCVADAALRLCGGGRRLEARNAHQAPRVAVLAGAHRVGAAALHAGRLLASCGARVAALRPPPGCAEAEVALAAAEGAVELATHAPELGPADVVVLALHDPAAGQGAGAAAALQWARGARCVLCVEPPGAGWEGVAARASVLAVTAGSVPPPLGRVLLANVCPPPRLFSDLGLHYEPPFGAASLLPLHPADD